MSRKSELEDVVGKSRKTMTMYGALCPKSNKNRLYIKRKEREKKKEKENSLGFTLPILKKTSSEELLQLRESILKML